MREMRKHDRTQIDALLTRQQAVLFKKLVVQQQFLQLLLSPEFFLGNEGDGKSGIVNRIHATAEQKEELRRLVEEADKLALRYTRERGAAAMTILSPEQQDKLIDALDRPAEPLNVQPPAGKQGTLTKIGVGTLTLSNATDANDATKAGEARTLGAAKGSDGWGPEHNGLRTRLLPAQKQYVIGRSARFRLEMKNFGESERKYDSQGVDVNGTIRITGPDGKPVRYVGGGFQTAGHSRSIAPGETVVLFDGHDFADQYSLVKAGSYTLQFRGTNVKWDAESEIPPSAEIAIEMRPGKPPVSMQVPARLGETLPEKWSLSLNGRVHEVKDGKVSPPGWESGSGTFMSLIPPSGSKRNPLSVPIWITERRLAWTGTQPFLVGTEWTKKEVTPSEGAVYLGKGADGYVYWKVPKDAESQWPDIRAKVTAALQIEP